MAVAIQPELLIAPTLAAIQAALPSLIDRGFQIAIIFCGYMAVRDLADDVHDRFARRSLRRLFAKGTGSNGTGKRNGR